ncbi:hypothetical protein KY290_019197 [Solanum tuberosum]|uniref:Uncharacterized protein n=1 Tax=Solanum tuberosum TaxID=4113 RepID=A0ABQ7VGC5_SOLTU|nr:hypothetical protein KY284_018144 [Solanum tuberosum]KAH0703868.1 hypothetical protein KY285_018146 [Solanum tuberosum]KAH0763124.1 hypothetical protein KY290_019197 [Solanum tuberosum]
MHHNIKRCLILSMSNVDARKKDAFTLVCSQCVAASVATRPASAVWTCSAAVLDVPPSHANPVLS